MVEKDGSTPRRLPPRLSPEEALARKAVRERRDAEMRGVASIDAMRAAIRQAARALPHIATVPRLGKLDAAAFRARAAAGLPFLVPGLAARWPLASLTPQTLRERFSTIPVRARVGDYVGTAFAPDRAMRDMSMLDYLDLAASGAAGLPPYLGNLELRELNRFCHWPAWFDKPGPPRFWLGPAGTVTPLHADYDDNIFVQLWGSKRIFLAPPHHDEFLYPVEANALLFGSPFDPEAPDYARFPLARQAALLELVVEPGDLLYVPAGWYHQVRALGFSLSTNRWSRAMPAVLQPAP
ncbi:MULTISPECIES: cupin-like domain-containing protein [unclassified Massilia]|uniref:cupin-like domain-containing protein n=1 Tax=unclassified Massilia TaxID=2609279 RepID=UPI00178453C1|nr:MULTISPECIES: cupin-like domain-containing protein [unclassified Massilia]MBD8528381.1 cupin-like domain-containing protein [Massilia sp. CFBP 13647]MBD8671997.1 cupin-like domain-containing protein [Massilia sp. CFBP 13721]